MSLLSICNLSATVQRSTPTIVAGGRAEVWGDVYTNVPSCLQPAKGSIVEDFMRRQMKTPEVWYADGQYALLPGDRIVVDGVKYLVDSSGDMGGRQRYTRVYVTRLG